VLSLDTGHQRDYGEGAAYREYFATDGLMFAVPKLGPRLPNKAEVPALRSADAPGEQLDIAADFLAANRVYESRGGSRAGMRGTPRRIGTAAPGRWTNRD
jgi:hypothetical protein